MLVTCLHEAYTMLANDLRSRVDDSGQKHAKEIPAIEQNARWKSFISRHPGQRFLSITRPSFELCNMAAAMHTKNVLTYIPLVRCTVESGVAAISGCGPWNVLLSSGWPRGPEKSGLWPNIALFNDAACGFC